jgi:5'-3' exonuclease
MGIPSYFSHIIKNYSNIIRTLGYFVNSNTFRFQHLYMDCNSIVYDAVHFFEKQKRDGTIDWSKDFESLIIDKVIDNIDNYVRLINPTTTIYIAFDGVAPFAKMDQQRTRRHKTLFLSKVDFGKDTAGPSWNTSAITPGTDFMNKLNSQVYYKFRNSETKYSVKNVIVSGSDNCGEGEHKLFQHMRDNDFKNDQVAVYGLDSDLIMLSIFHLKYCKNVHIFREAPEFLKSSIPIDTTSKETDPHFLDIFHLSSCISAEMACKFADLHRTVDYIFLCFFLGNDFLPHFPAMNIRTHGINALLDIYRNYIGSHSDRYFVSKTTGNIQWRNVGIFISQVAKREHEFLTNEYFVRAKSDRRTFAESTPEEKEDAFNSAPIMYRAAEKYICPDEPYWESRYYKSLFELERTPDNVKTICNNYLEGLEWVFKYYTRGCPSWRWKYNYHYPPLFVDLDKHMPHFEMEFLQLDDRPAFSPQVQLSYVLPRKSLALLPDKLNQFLLVNYPELYPEDYDFQWSFCRYFWEAHPLLPEISVELLSQWEIQFRMNVGS